VVIVFQAWRVERVRRVLVTTKGRVVLTQVVGRTNAVRRVCSVFFDGGVYPESPVDAANTKTMRSGAEARSYLVMPREAVSIAPSAVYCVWRQRRYNGANIPKHRSAQET
jgi:hypothetical protein